jgi:uncharacterized protein YprB with RNaseH-like and TPR domain
MGVRSWQDVIERAERIPHGWRHGLVEESHRCIAALESNDIAYLVQRLNPPDQWRIMARYLGEASFFDIETAGLEYDDPITLIVCWHRGALHTFVEHENLDDFLKLLDDVTLLSSFNGGSFDVPRVLDAFHIPELPCPHLDLRWLCYHQGLRGGLKQITMRQGIGRPVDLQHADGELAVRLWARWEHFNDHVAREELIRYCAADVLLTVALAQHLVGHTLVSLDELWRHLPTNQDVAAPQGMGEEITPPETLGAFGAASPAKLRGRRWMIG